MNYELAVSHDTKPKTRKPMKELTIRIVCFIIGIALGAYIGFAVGSFN